MNSQRLHIRQYGWVVTVYYPVTPLCVRPIMKHLVSLGCSGDALVMSWRNLSSGKFDTGLTFSNFLRRSSVMVVGKASSFGELMNSLSHEIHHLSVHMAQAYGLDLSGEEVCYMDGKATQLVFETPLLSLSFDRHGNICAIPFVCDSPFHGLLRGQLPSSG